MNTQILLLTGLLTASAVGLQAQTTLNLGHADVGIGYEASAWDLHVHRHGPPEQEFDPAEVILQVNASARTRVPVDPAYSFLGNAGSDLWILPKSEDPNLLFLGIGAEELGPADWIGNLTLSLDDVRGPGEFYVWDVDSFGTPVVKMNSRDGIGVADRLEVVPGSHGHFFLGFSASGDYRVSLEASGTPLAGGFTASGPVEYQFTVVPEPSTLALLAAGGLVALATRLGRRRPERRR